MRKSVDIKAPHLHPDLEAGALQHVVREDARQVGVLRPGQPNLQGL